MKLICFILILHCSIFEINSRGQNDLSSPCPQYFKYELKDDQHFYGLLEIPILRMKEYYSISVELLIQAPLNRVFN